LSEDVSVFFFFFRNTVKRFAS